MFYRYLLSFTNNNAVLLFAGKPVKDGTQREQHLEVDSIILNPYAEDGREESPRQSHNAARGKKKDQFSKLGRNKMKAQNEPNVYRANAKSTSGGMNRVQNSNTNRPRPTMQVEEPVFPEVHLPRTISFHTKSVANRDELEDNTIWQDGKSFGFVEEQQQPIQINGQRSGIFSSNGRNNAASTIGGDPLELKRRQLERLKEGKCLRKFAMSSITKLERQQSRQQSRHPSMQQSIQKSMQQSIQPSIYGGQSTAKKKGPFALLRSLSRGRARSKNQGRPQRPQNTQPQYDQDMFETGMDQEASEIPFTTNMPQFGFTHVEESAGRTPPDFDEEPMYTHAPAQRTSSRSRRRRDDGAEMNPHGHRPRSQSRPRQMRGPPSAHPLQSRRSRSVPRTRPMPPNDPMQYQSHRPRSVSRSKHDRSMSQNQMQGASSGRSRSRSRRAQPTDPRNGSESRGRERMSNDGSQWLRSTSKGRVHDQRNPNPTGRMQRVQGLQRNQSRHQNNAPMQNGPSSSRNRSRSRSRKHGQDMNDDNQYNPNMTYKQSIKSGRTQHTDAHMVRSISNKGKSATMGMLELSMSDDNDNYFVGY